MPKIIRSKAAAEDIDIIDQYTVADGLVSVQITGDGRYIVEEPPFQESANISYSVIMDKILESVVLDIEGKSESEKERYIYDKFWEVGSTIYRQRELEGLFHSLKYYLMRDMTGYGILHPLMTDPDIEDILVSAPARPVYIKHKRHGNRFHSLKSNIMFPTDQHMVTFINRMFLHTGNEPTVVKPGMVTYLHDMSRISVTLSNIVSEPGSTIAIRKFPKKPFVITHMMRTNTLTPRMAAFVWSLLDAQGAGLVIGTTGSGKTTLLSALTTMMNPRWRILSIEDSLELRIPHEDWVRYRTKKTTSTVGAEHDITISKLIDQSLTQKPDYEIIGEIRDVADAKQLFQSMGTGHGGLCLPPGEMLPVRCGGIISYGTIRDIIDRFRDGEILYTYSMAGGRCGWYPITGTIVKHGRDDWRRFTAGGATCTVHAGHLMITDRGVIPASDVMPGDSIPVIEGLHRDAHTHLENNDGVIQLNAASGMILTQNQIDDLRHFALSGPEDFVQACGDIIPKRYHPINDNFSYEAVDTVERPSLGQELYDIEVRSVSNFTHGDGIISHNTTFHANTPRGALTRMELGGVGPEEIALLSFIIYITEIRISGVKKRRIRNITEISPDETGRPKLRDLFKYELKDDSFKETQGLLKSTQYKEACFRNNVLDPISDMDKREKLLKECIEKEADDIDAVFKILGRYYT